MKGAALAVARALIGPIKGAAAQPGSQTG